jgi:enoyl-CoA hydratase
MIATGNPHIRAERNGRVLLVTIDRDDKLNALSWAMIDALIATLRQAENDPEVGAIVLRGAGRAFSTGFDLKDSTAEVPASPQDDMKSFRRAAAAWRALWEIRKPVIAAVHGHCLAGALEIALHADFVIAADDCQFGYPAVRASGLPDTHMFIYRLGVQWTRWLLMTGQTFDAATAAQMGLTFKTVAPDDLEAEALALAQACGQVPPAISQGAKAVINQAIELMGYGALQHENWAQSALARADPAIMEFDRIARADGLKAALEWRDGKSGEAQ